MAKTDTEKLQQQEMSLEESFACLDELMEKLENTETSLEDSFRLYQNGMELIKKCSEKIERVETKVLMMNEDGGLDEF